VNEASFIRLVLVTAAASLVVRAMLARMPELRRIVDGHE
jgi:hypothetical protein